MKYSRHKGKTFAANNTPCSYQFFNRHGGVSNGVFASLNVGTRLGDQEEAVLENRVRVKKSLAASHILSARQVHGTGIYCLSRPLTEDLEVEEYDALVTDQKGVGLMIQQADCQAVLLFDQAKGVIAAVHCGWRGSVQRILQQVVSVMVENYGTSPPDLQAVISPSLGPCCAEFIHHREELPTEFQRFMVRENYFDFWQISSYQLTEAGISAANIKAAKICTCCSDDYFSYRRASHLDAGRTGRHCSVIVLG